MLQPIDFSDAEMIIRQYGGSDQKMGVRYNGKEYMLKFSQFHAKRTEISTSYVNSVLSEYICSHIAASIGLPVHNTLLGLYSKAGSTNDLDEKVIVVACEVLNRAVFSPGTAGFAADYFHQS